MKVLHKSDILSRVPKSWESIWCGYNNRIQQEATKKELTIKSCYWEKWYGGLFWVIMAIMVMKYELWKLWCIFWESHGSELLNPLQCQYVTLKMAFLMVTMAALQAFQTMNIGIDMTYVSTLWSMSTMAFLKTHRFQSAVCALNVLSTAISRYLRLIILTSS